MEVKEPAALHSDKALYDMELVERAKAGDQRAFAKLLSRYRDSIYFMLLKMVGNKTDAEDLTIEAFGKAFRNIGLYSPTYAFSTWLFKIASNNGIDFIRRKRTKVMPLETDINDNPPNDPQAYHGITVSDESPDPAEALIRRQRIDAVRMVVEKLKPRYRKLVELRYFNEYSYEEIAAEMDMPVGTVKAQLFRSRELLSSILKNVEDLKY